MKNPVYEEIASELVPATGHGEGIFYRIFIGTVTWREEPVPALTVFMQYGGERSWAAACREGQIAFQIPAHIALVDADEVGCVMSKMAAEIAKG